MAEDDPPAHRWDTSTLLESGINPERLDEFITFADAFASEPDGATDQYVRKAGRLRAVLGPQADIDIVGQIPRPGSTNRLVLRHGSLVADFGDTGHVDQIASATKSFLSLLCGVALEARLIGDVHESVFEPFGRSAEQSSSPRDHLASSVLQQTSE